jgi:hypothetical protein
MATEYIALAGSMWCNTTGSGVYYGWDGERFSTREAAIAHGFTLDRSDDFNIGVLQDGELVSLDWMDEVVENDPSTLADIEEELGL